MQIFVDFKKRPLILALTAIGLSIINYTAHANDQIEHVHHLEIINVTADKNQSSEQQQGYLVNRTKTSTKLDLQARETPQNVKVYSKEYLEDRNIQSFQSLVNHVSGVSTSRTDERQTTYARGFAMDYFLLDGIPTTANISEGDLDLNIFDRVEVVKGANGLTTGAGNPAMGMNFIRKRADSKALVGQVQASVGSWNSYQASADVSSALNDDGSLRGRVFLKHSDEDSYMQGYERTRRIAYAALDYDISDTTLFSLATTYQQLERKGIRWGGLPAFYSDGSLITFDRDYTISSDWTYWNIDTTAVFADLKQKLWGDANLNIAYSYRNDDKQTALLYFGGRVDKSTGLGTVKADPYTSDSNNQENNIDLYINMPFQWNGFEQEVLIGGSWNKRELVHSYAGKPILNNYTLNFNAPINIGVPPDLSTPNVLDPNQTEQTGFYLAAKFQLFDPLKVVTGVRLSNWEYRSDTGKSNREFKEELTPYIGLIYDLDQNHSWYVSYTDIFKPQDRKDQQGIYLDPIVAKNYETGVKSQWFDGRLATTVALFRIEQDNAAERIEGSFVLDSKEQAYRAVQGVVSKGAEIEVVGKLTDNWSVNFGVANYEAKDQNGTKVSLDSARTTGTVFTKYNYAKWNLGAGLNYRSDISNGAGKDLIEQDPIWLASAMVAYEYDENIKLQLNLDNLFDEKYYDGIGPFRMNYGDPRKATFSVKYQF